MNGFRLTRNVAPGPDQQIKGIITERDILWGITQDDEVLKTKKVVISSCPK